MERAPILSFTTSCSNLSRTGNLLFTSSNSQKIIQTPAIIAYSRRGALPHLTRDNVAKLPIEMIALSLDHLLDLDPPSFSQAPYSLHRFIGLQESKTQKQPILVLGLKDSTCISERINGDKFNSCNTMRGIIKVTPSNYSAWTLPRPPDILIALSDSTILIPGKKRMSKILSRSATYLEEILTQTKSLQNVFAPLVGCTLQDRLEYAQGLLGLSQLPQLNHTLRTSDEITLDSKVSGYALTVTPPIPSLTTTSTIPELFNTSLSALPIDKPRMVISASGPHDILRLIQKVGIDLFLDSWSTDCSSYGIALDFNFPVPSNLSLSGKKEIGHNLFSAQFAESFEPLSNSNLANLSNYQHPFGPIVPTKAYTHHLLWQHELTSHVILALNNQIIMHNFFKEIRRVLSHEAGGEGFDKEVERFMEVYQDCEGGEFSGGEYKCLKEARKDFKIVELNRGKGSTKTEKEIL